MKSSQLLAIAMAGALGFMSMSSAAEDQSFDDRFYVAPMLSYGVFTEDTFKPDDQFSGGQLAFGKNLTEYLALELYAFHFNDILIEDGDGTVAGIDSTGYGLSALLFPARDLFPVFALVGIGAGTYDFDGLDVPANTNEQDASFYDLGIGFIYPITDYGIAIRAEYRYRSVDVDAAGGGEYNFRNDIISVGIQIPLGAKPEPEVQPATLPPEPEPEPVVPPKPPQPTDSDGDGVPDDRDRCPGTPAEAKVNRFGCPVEKEQSIVLKGVHFEFDSAALTAEAEDRLDSVINALKSAEEIEVKIAGHTDSIGSAAYNLKLSKERAESVKEYLVNHGIDPDRLTTVGYGETRPIAPNTTEEGRAKNRRVELHVVEEADGK